MAEQLKNIYNRSFFEFFTEVVKDVLPSFDKQAFLARIFDAAWEQRELKQRMRHIAFTLHEFLPVGYPEATEAICKMIQLIRDKYKKEMAFEYMFFPDYIEVFGLEDYETSVKAMEYITEFTSCEFAVRPFLIRYQEQMMKQMLQWSKHPHAMVRRLASEGTRPRLPWAMAVPALKKNPELVLPILENLKTDVSETVRRSVANNLNDIAKSHPELVLKVIKNWWGQTPETDWIIRHGCRTLLRKAHPDVMSHFGYAPGNQLEVKELKLKSSAIKIGAELEFSFRVVSKEKEACKTRIEYGIDYMKANGRHSRKIFKVCEKIFKPGESVQIQRRQDFREMTTRKHYVGRHFLAVLINGEEKVKGEFEVGR